MQGLADFATSLVEGLVVVAVALACGGAAFALVIVRPLRIAAPTVVRRSLAVIVLAALATVAVELARLGLTAAVLREWAGPDAGAAFLDTLQARAGAGRIVAALGLAILTVRLRRRPDAPGRWAAVGLGALALVASGGWLAHAAGRLDERGKLMALTVLHELGAALWVGGVGQLVALYALGRRDRAAAAAWPALVRGFAVLAIAGVGVLVVSGIALAVPLVGAWEALVGSGYGSLVATKTVLLAVAAALGATSFLAARRRSDAVHTRVPALVQTEAIILASALFTAASLATQPPSVDTPGEHATVAEVIEVFRPKVPALATPGMATMVADASDPLAVVGGERSAAAYLWSNFSHNVAGLILLAMSVAALVARIRPRSLARHWPAGFVLLAVFVFLRTSANDGIWPFGPVGVWESMRTDAEVLQHRLGAFLALALGLVEWRARATPGRPAPTAWIFPILCGAGGVLLLTHAHAAFEPKAYFLVQVTHTAMGALAVLVAAARTLELRLDGAPSRAAGAAAETAMLLVALVLVFYREANVVIPPHAV